MNPDDLELDEAGWVRQARQVRSPNFDARPHGTGISLIVIHSISVPPGDWRSLDVERLFTNCLTAGDHPAFAALFALRVSSHFVIDRTGGLTQFVSCLDRAWHAGKSAWRGRESCNDFSVGVELVGGEFEPFSQRQYDSLRRLTNLLTSSFRIEGVRGHEEIAPGRKFDPGPYFDWRCVARDIQRVDSNG